MKSKKNKKTKKLDVLVLNRSWIPVHIITWDKAMTLMVKEAARPLDRELDVYDFKTWLEYSAAHNDYPTVATTKQLICLPEIVILSHFDRLPLRDVKYTRTTLFERDKFTCCFCGKHFPKDELTVDHVIPRCKGGKSTWDNTVTACKPCNNFKDDRTPQEAGLKMHFHPKKPKWISPLSKVGHEHPCKSWQKFLNKALIG